MTGEILVNLLPTHSTPHFLQIHLVPYQYYACILQLLLGEVSQFAQICFAQKSTVLKLSGAVRSNTIITASLFLQQRVSRDRNRSWPAVSQISMTKGSPLESVDSYLWKHAPRVFSILLLKSPWRRTWMILVFPTSSSNRSYLTILVEQLWGVSSQYNYLFQMKAQDEEPPQSNGCFYWLCFKTWYPFSTLRSVIFLSLLLGFIFMTIAVVQFVIYQNGYQKRVAYSTEGKCSGSSTTNRCQIQISLDKDLQQPILLMYVIEGAYINHRKYINSISEDQLKGKAIDMSTAKTLCTPFVTNGDLGVNTSYGGSPLVSTNIGYPCGFKPFLVFNDTYSLFDSNGKKIPIDETQLDPDYSNIFQSPQGSQKDQWISVVNEHFNVWTKDQAMIGKYKLWGRINQNMPKGNYNLVVNNNYQINKLRLKKSIELVMPTKLGGPLYFFPISFMIMGLICIGYVIFLKSEMADYDAVVSGN